MRKIGFVPSASDEEKKESKPDFNEQVVSSYIDENYSVTGEVDQKEFRTTLELITEMSEMVSVGMTTVNVILQEKGFKTTFIDGVSNWILYEKTGL